MAVEAAPPPVGEGRFDALVLTETAGFVHDSIPAGVEALNELGEANDFSVTIATDSSVFTTDELSAYEVVVFLNTTGDVLSEDEQAAFESYVRGGGGFAGVHSAADTELDWDFYVDELLGASFVSHPAVQEATVRVEDPAHPSTSGLPQEWTFTDEWYNYDVSPRDSALVLANLDEDSYDVGVGAMGEDHPIVWCQVVDEGRSWYTALGHEIGTYADADFRDHLLGGIESAAGAVASNCDATDEAAYDKVALHTGSDQPMELDIDDEGRVYYIERDGRVILLDTDGTVQTMLALNVSGDFEQGLLGIALAPDFAASRHMYLYYSPADAGLERLSRFTVDESFESIDAASEVAMLDVPVLDNCCHNGGALEFDNDGNLFIATGDNTNPFQSQGYTPIDEQAGREFYDAQRTSANTNSLSGKILRITPQADGSYTIPDGNLFAPGTASTLPEIYVMGVRNPFRIGLDPLTNNLMMADFGPDAGTASADRGPEGRVEWSIISEPGNHGWPYCHGSGVYMDYDFGSETSSGAFDCDNLVNESPNNTGLVDLPPNVDPDVWYGKAAQDVWPEFGTGGAPMGGPVYRYDAALDSSVKWPAYFDGKAIFGEWGSPGDFFTIQLDEAGAEVQNIDRLFSNGYISQPMAMEFGPDGALYVIDWGGATNSGIYRIEYLSGAGGGPSAVATADVTSGAVPLDVQFDGTGSSVAVGAIAYDWDLDGDGTSDSTEATPTFTYSEPGQYQVLLRVTDGDGNTATSTIDITAGNAAPVVDIVGPVEGGFAEFGDTINYEVAVTDAEDGAVACGDVSITPALGHDDHGHPDAVVEGCEGQFLATIDDSHGPEADVYIIVEADYTDGGGDGGAPALSGTDLITLQPKFKQAEYFEETGKLDGVVGAGDVGVRRQATDDGGGFQSLAFIDDGDYWTYDPINLFNMTGLSARVSSATAGGSLEVRWDSPTGELLATIDVPATGGWGTYTDVAVDFDVVPTGTGTLYFVAADPAAGSGYLFNVNWIEFIGEGVTVEQTVPPAGAVLQAEDYESTGKLDGVVGAGDVGVRREATADGGGVESVAYIDDGDYWNYPLVDLVGMTGLSARVSSATAGGTLEVRSGSEVGELLATIEVPSTGDWHTTYTDVAVDLDVVPTEAGPLYFVARDPAAGSNYLFNVNWFEFIGDE